MQVGTNEDDGLSEGRISGIFLAVVLFLVATVGGVRFYMVWRRQKRASDNNTNNDDSDGGSLSTDPDDSSSSHSQGTPALDEPTAGTADVEQWKPPTTPAEDKTVVPNVARASGELDVKAIAKLLRNGRSTATSQRTSYGDFYEMRLGTIPE